MRRIQSLFNVWLNRWPEGLQYRARCRSLVLCAKSRPRLWSRESCGTSGRACSSTRHAAVLCIHTVHTLCGSAPQHAFDLVAFGVFGGAKRRARHGLYFRAVLMSREDKPAHAHTTCTHAHSCSHPHAVLSSAMNYAVDSRHIIQGVISCP